MALVQLRWQTRPFTAAKRQPKAWETEADEEVKEETPVKRRRGRPRKDVGPNAIVGAIKEKTSTATAVEAADGESAPNSSPKKRTRSRTIKTDSIPARLLSPVSKNHNDLPSFLTYAARTDLNTASNVYKGTHYEYTVASALSAFNFTLHRTGRSNDLGIDLVGHFGLPHPTKVSSRGRGRETWHELRVLVQCKALKPTPAMVRELEGAYVGAPAGWNSEGVLALLVASHAATKGVRDALQRSRWPMGLLQVTGKGEVRQFLWNPVAAQIGLEGLGVTVRYGEGAGAGTEDEGEMSKIKSTIALTWLGKLWRPAESTSK